MKQKWSITRAEEGKENPQTTKSVFKIEVKWTAQNESENNSFFSFHFSNLCFSRCAYV